MKKLSTIMILAAAFIAALVFSGCNRDTKYVEVGDPIVVEESISLACGVPFMVRAVAPNEDTNVSIEYGDINETYVNEYGIDVFYMVGYECPVEEPTEVEPEDGICPAGWEFANDCATVCTPIEEICLTESLCGEGTILDDNNTCQIDSSPDMGICGEGTELDENGTTCIITPVPEPI